MSPEVLSLEEQRAEYLALCLRSPAKTQHGNLDVWALLIFRVLLLTSLSLTSF